MHKDVEIQRLALDDSPNRQHNLVALESEIDNCSATTSEFDFQNLQRYEALWRRTTHG